MWGSNLPQAYVEEFGFKKHRGKISASVWVRIKIKNNHPPPKALGYVGILAINLSG